MSSNLTRQTLLTTHSLHLNDYSQRIALHAALRATHRAAIVLTDGREARAQDSPWVRYEYFDPICHIHRYKIIISQSVASS